MPTNKKRHRKPKAKPGQLLAQFGKLDGEIDLFYCFNGSAKMGHDAKLLSYAFERLIIFQEDGRTLRQELEARGYDITTLKFTISKKEQE